MHERYSNDAAIAKADVAVLRFNQSTAIELLEWGKALFSKTIHVEDI